MNTGTGDGEEGEKTCKNCEIECPWKHSPTARACIDWTPKPQPQDGGTVGIHAKALLDGLECTPTAQDILDVLGDDELVDEACCKCDTSRQGREDSAGECIDIYRAVLKEKIAKERK
jgi:hypothetical protein